MKNLLLFGFIACVNANLRQNVLNIDWTDYGTYDGLVKIGNLTERYLPMSKDDLRASKNAAHFLEEARRFFRTGFYTLPPLDPYYKASLPTFVVDDEVNLKGTITLINLNVTGLIKFTTNLLEVRLDNGRVDYRVNVPQLNIETDADLDLTAARIIPFRTRGILSLALRNVVVRGALHAVPVVSRGVKVFQLRAQHTRLHADNLKAKFLPFFKGHSFLESSALGYGTGPLDDWFGVLKQHVDEYLVSLVQNQANLILDGPSVEQVLAILLGPQGA